MANPVLLHYLVHITKQQLITKLDLADSATDNEILTALDTVQVQVTGIIKSETSRTLGTEEENFIRVAIAIYILTIRDFVPEPGKLNARQELYDKAIAMLQSTVTVEPSDTTGTGWDGDELIFTGRTPL